METSFPAEKEATFRNSTAYGIDFLNIFAQNWADSATVRIIRIVNCTKK